MDIDAVDVDVESDVQAECAEALVNEAVVVCVVSPWVMPASWHPYTCPLGTIGRVVLAWL